MEYRHLQVKHEPPVTRLILSRPEKRNALSLELMREVVDALTDIPGDIQVVVISGEGPAFSAGHDLGEMLLREQVWAGREKRIQ